MNVSRAVRLAIRPKRRTGRDNLANPRLVLFGDSHVHAIQEAIRHREAKGRTTAIEARRLLKVKNDKSIGNTTFEEFLEIARSLGPDDIVLSVIGGNQHAVFSTIKHPDAFDFLMPEEEGVPVAEGATVIPYRTLFNLFADGIRGGDGKSIEALRKATVARMVHLIAPPPKGDNSFIEKYHDTRFAGENIASLGVSQPELRMKFWRLQNRAIRELCAKLGIEVLGPPDDACTADGALAPACYAKDATHANAAYGELVLQQLEQRYLSESHVSAVA
jgi:hypothetical protein